MASRVPLGSLGGHNGLSIVRRSSKDAINASPANGTQLVAHRSQTDEEIQHLAENMSRTALAENRALLRLSLIHI